MRNKTDNKIKTQNITYIIDEAKLKIVLYGRATHIYQDKSQIRKVSLLKTAPGHQASLARQTHSKQITHSACSEAYSQAQPKEPQHKCPGFPESGGKMWGTKEAIWPPWKTDILACFKGLPIKSTTIFFLGFFGFFFFFFFFFCILVPFLPFLK